MKIQIHNSLLLQYQYLVRLNQSVLKRRIGNMKREIYIPPYMFHAFSYDYETENFNMSVWHITGSKNSTIKINRDWDKMNWKNLR